MRSHRKIMARSLSSILFVCLIFPVSALADDLIMRRIPMSFPEAMSALQTSIAEEGRMECSFHW